MAGEEHDARGSILFHAFCSPELRVVQEQVRSPMSAFVYTFDHGHHCTDKTGTSLQAAKIKESVSCKPLVRISPSDLDNLLMTLEVEFVKLSECVVGPGWRLTMATTNAPGIHYDLIGTGRMIIGHHPPIDLRPHTLIIVPAGQSFCIEGADDKRRPATLTITEENARTSVSGALSRFAASMRDVATLPS